MTITEQLESIILKYKLDNAYPRFRSYVKCKKIVKKLFSEYTEKDTILLLSSEEDSLNFALVENKMIYEKTDLALHNNVDWSKVNFYIMWK
ncbi:MAG: hypothetical protein LBC85_05905 [Fibromonadaceae bacterium]|jgi:hypothetical protein|nr:hypothetical protein [Fibromonadaceae bacterium]